MVSTSSFAMSGGGLEVDRRALAVVALFEIVADPLVLVQAGKSGSLDGADMDKGVGAARIVRDEAVAAVVIEEFDGACGHGAFLDCIDMSAGRVVRVSHEA